MTLMGNTLCSMHQLCTALEQLEAAVIQEIPSRSSKGRSVERAILYMYENSMIDVQMLGTEGKIES